MQPSKREPRHVLPHPSVVTFAKEVAKILLPLLFDLFPPNLHFHLTSALLPPPLVSQDVKSVPFIILVYDFCHVSMHVRCVHIPNFSCRIWRQRQAGIKAKKHSTSPISQCLSFTGFLPFFLSTFGFVLSLLSLDVAAEPWDASSPNLTFLIRHVHLLLFFSFISWLKYSSKFTVLLSRTWVVQKQEWCLS